MGIFRSSWSSRPLSTSKRRSSGSYTAPAPKVQLGDPQPHRYSIVKIKSVGKHLVVRLNYPDCENYGGDKICLYTNTKIEDFVVRKVVDPHFLEKGKSPFARFEPTDSGWLAAVKLAESL